MRYLSLRLIIAYFSVILTGICFVGVMMMIPSPQIQIIRLDQIFGFLSLIYLYLSLLISPLYTVFSSLPHKKIMVAGRRSIGIFSFIFALLHTSFAFFGQLNGFKGLLFLSNTYILSLILGFIGLEILMILALTSFDKAVTIFSFSRWKILHRFVYLAGMLILIHTFMLGTHFLDTSTLIPQITITLFAFLMILEAIRFDKYLEKRKLIVVRFGISLTVILFVFLIYIVSSFFPAVPFSLGIHAQHLLLAKQAQQTSVPTNLQNIPGLSGDPHLRFNASMNHDPAIMPGEPTTISFTIYNAANGDKTNLFSRVYEKTMHLIIVDESLNYFSHLHPTQTDEGFAVTTTLPKEGTYHLYIDFQPLGAIEQQIGFTVVVGNPDAISKGTLQPDTLRTKHFGKYNVSISYLSPLDSKELSLGQQKLSFTLKDAQTNKPITTLKPYLASFGHLSLINEKTFEFIHVHPALLIPPAPNSNGGPTVDFLPLGLYGPISPGIYHVFAEFNPDNHLITTDFTVKIE